MPLCRLNHKPIAASIGAATAASVLLSTSTRPTYPVSETAASPGACGDHRLADRMEALLRRAGIDPEQE